MQKHLNKPETDQKEVLQQLRTIPGVGKSISRDLWNLGIRSVADLKGRSPERLYRKLCELQGMPVDRCVLYVFRCAVYYASHGRHNSRLLHWWNWKNQ
jgi:hypothetical protein